MLLLLLLVLAAPLWAGGDTIEMKDGRLIKGHIVAKNAMQIYIDTGTEEVERIDVSEIAKIHFGPVVTKPGPETEEKPAV